MGKLTMKGVVRYVKENAEIERLCCLMKLI